MFIGVMNNHCWFICYILEYEIIFKQDNHMIDKEVMI